MFQKLFESEFNEGLRPTQEQFDLIDEIVKGYGDEDLCELLFQKSPKGYDPDKLASFFSMLVWQTSDNGEKVCETLRKWLAGSDLNRIAVARSREFEVKL